MSILNKLIEDNQLPIIFVGSGISKRYLNEFPNWMELLRELWEVTLEDNFYGKYNNIRDEMKKENRNLNDKQLDYYTNIKISTLLEDKYNKMFNEGKIKVPNFTPKEAYQEKVSPFKKAIANRFSNYEVIDEKVNEIESLKSMLTKSQIILTTNYDTFIEDIFNLKSDYEIKKYIGQRGFFDQSIGIAELYKVHGSIEEPNSIVITKNDYDEFNKNSILISSRIISLLIHSPIIFIGYSISDVNIREIIKDFTSSIPENEIINLEEKIILIERLEDEKELVEEIIQDNDLGCKINVIRTDNFEEVYKQLSKINQGIAPTEIRKYQHIIKKLVIDKGKEGSLKTVLLAPEELDKLEENMRDRKIAVALGDEKYIYQMPDIVSYCIDYFSNANEINTNVQIRFVNQQQPNSRFPINKLFDDNILENSSATKEDIKKLKLKKQRFSDFSQHNTIIPSFILNVDKIAFENITKEYDNIENKTKLYATLSHYIKELDINKVKEFILEELRLIQENGERKIETELRRLMLLCDILLNKESSN